MDYVDTVSKVGSVIIVICLAAVMLNGVFTAVGNIHGADSTDFTDEGVNIVGGSGTASDAMRNVSGQQSLGTSLAFTGAPDSELTADSGLDLSSSGSWTACTFATVDSTATTTSMTALSVDGRAIIQYNATGTDTWSLYYYNDSTRNSYRVEVAAPDPTNRTQVCGWYDGSELRIYRNTTLGGTADTSLDSSADVSENGNNWHGTLEEARVFNQTLDSTQRQALVSNPTHPVDGATPTARIMFDGWGSLGSSVTSMPIYFTDSTASVSNATLADGINGESLTYGDDYRTKGDRVYALDGGKVDGAPVIFLTFEPVGLAGFSGIYTALVTTGPAALGLLVIGVLMFAGMKVYDEMTGF